MAKKFPGVLSREFFYSSKIFLFLRLIPHIRYIINRNKRFRVLLVYKLHQLLIFTFIYNGNDLILFFHVVGADCLIDRCTAVQVMNDELTKLLFFLCNNAHTPLDIMVKNKMIQNNSVEIRSQNTQDYCFFHTQAPPKVPRTYRKVTWLFPAPCEDICS